MEKEMTREQIAYDAKDLFAGGWRASDRDEFKKEYGLTEWEDDVTHEENKIPVRRQKKRLKK